MDPIRNPVNGPNCCWQFKKELDKRFLLCTRRRKLHMSTLCMRLVIMTIDSPVHACYADIDMGTGSRFRREVPSVGHSSNLRSSVFFLRMGNMFLANETYNTTRLNLLVTGFVATQRGHVGPTQDRPALQSGNRCSCLRYAPELLICSHTNTIYGEAHLVLFKC